MAREAYWRVGDGKQAAGASTRIRVSEGLAAIAERWPEIKGSKEAAKLMRELQRVEAAIAQARMSHNEAVSLVRTGIEQFPSSLFAAKFGGRRGEYFEL